MSYKLKLSIFRCKKDECPMFWEHEVMCENCPYTDVDLEALCHSYLFELGDYIENLRKNQLSRIKKNYRKIIKQSHKEEVPE